MARVMRLAVLAAVACSLLVGVAWADMPTFRLTIRDHRFEPAVLEVPTGQTIKLLIHNADPTPEEFESQVLNREKIVPGGTTVTVYLSSLSAGSYGYYGDFHQDTAKGRIVAK